MAGVEAQAPARRTDSGIDNDQVDCARGEITPRLRKSIRSLGNAVGLDLMRDVHQLGVRADAQDAAFHRADVVIGESEIGEQGNDWPLH